MCGIAGILSFTERVEEPVVEKMLSTLVHRGPDGQGIFINKSGMTALGHRRLSIIDLADTGKQPMHYANERYSITFNGEIYNYIELRGELQKKGYTFRTNSDTEVLLALYDLKKEKALNDLDGMFAFAIWDELEQTLFCARDRFGEKPFYYHTNPTYFAFASEMKALFTLGISKEKNQKKVYDYLLYNTLEDPDNRSSTFYVHIHQLEPSHYMIINKNNEIIAKKYWDLDLTKNSSLSLSDSIEKFQELFTTSIQRRLRSDVPVGSSLSGGLDSSSIVLLIDQLKNKKSIQKTFSARFRDFKKDEGEYMNMVINKSNVEPHFVYPTIDSVMQNIESIFKYQEEPIGSASVAVQFEVMKLARQNGITVLLDGQGADEMLGGYHNFWESYFLQLYKTDKKKFTVEKKAYVDVHANFPYDTNLEFKLKALFPEGLNKVGNMGRRIKSPTSNFFLGIHPEMVTLHKKEINPIPKINNLKELLYFYLMKRGLNELLRYADRNAMANSVEVRLPFLFHELVEFTISLPPGMLLHKGWSKYILRKSMEDLLPKEITWRKDKIGFEPPQSNWMDSPAFKDYLNEATSYLRKEKVITKEIANLNWNYISLYAFSRQ